MEVGSTVPLMTAPPETKTIRVSPETHKKVHDIAMGLNGSAEDAMRHLLSPNRVPIIITDEQRTRWEDAAGHAEMSVGEWVIYRVEAALLFEADPTTLMSELRAIRSMLNARTPGTP